MLGDVVKVGLNVPEGEGEEEVLKLPDPDTLPLLVLHPLPVTDTLELPLLVVDKDTLPELVNDGDTLGLTVPLALGELEWVDEPQVVGLLDPHELGEGL